MELHGQRLRSSGLVLHQTRTLVGDTSEWSCNILLAHSRSQDRWRVRRGKAGLKWSCVIHLLAFLPSTFCPQVGLPIAVGVDEGTAVGSVAAK